MAETALTAYHFTIDAAIAEWLTQKKGRTGSQKTRIAYQDTIGQFRAFLAMGSLDLLSNPIDVARVAAVWANTRGSRSRWLSKISKVLELTLKPLIFWRVNTIAFPFSIIELIFSRELKLTYLE